MLPGLARVDAIEDDLLLLCGARWQQLEIGRGTCAYVRRLKELDATRPGLLLAHAYVRYLGDLSGGQMLGRIVARSLDLPEGHGVSFYGFGAAAQASVLARAFREGLGRIELDTAQADAVVREASWSFRMHRFLFLELALAAGLTQGHANRPAALPAWP
jgi:heme oxygenase